MAHARRDLALRIVAALLFAALPFACRRAPRGATPGPSAPAATSATLAPEARAEAAAAIREILSAGRHPSLSHPGFARDQDEMASLYGPDCAPVWLEGSRPGDAARTVIDVLGEADTRGLSPEDYDVRRLERWWAGAGSAGGLAPAELGRFDAALSLLYMRHISDLRIGRVDPKTVKTAFDVKPRTLELADVVRDAIARGRVRTAVEEAEPPLELYRRLKEALPRFRQLATDASLGPVPEVRKLGPGDEYAGAPGLSRLLVALGDLPGDAVSVPAADGAAPRYEGALVDAVRRFQDRHGLTADGVVGKGTFARLNLSMARRVRLIELALERLRWAPVPADGPLIVVNLAAFRLWAVDRAAGVSRPALTMKVVVGRALRTETPVFGEELRYLVFRPYWNVPASIARSETLPAARREPGYLAAHDMEIVDGDRDDSPVVPPTPENLGRVGPGGLRIRQRPGPQNALGRVKFIFPNNANVYLHDTPSPGAFRLDRRDLSHGCVRLADPAALAEWLLRDVPGWSRERIEKAMREDAPQQVNLRAPVPVLLLYVTAVVDAQGQAAFFEDIYGHDRRLDALLRGGEPQSP